MSRCGGGSAPGALGARIRELRKAIGWTAIRLSHETGGVVSRHAIAKLESNFQENVSLAQGVALANALGVTCEDLLNVTIPPRALVAAREIAEARERLCGLMAVEERASG